MEMAAASDGQRGVFEVRQTMPDDNRPLHRTPDGMETWEIIGAYRHAHQLAGLRPNAQLSRALTNFLFKAQKELEQRGAWRPEYLTNT
jgi:hypothetical protein